MADLANAALRKNNPAIYSLLSKKGKEISYPKNDILFQAAEASNKKYNASIGIAIEGNKPMHLGCIKKHVKLEPREIFPYSTAFGNSELREKWKELIKRKNPSLKTETSLPVVTHAITHALSIAGYLFVNKGDKIVTPDVRWENYDMILGQYGCKLDTFPMFSGGRLNTKGLKKKLTGKGKKIILFNFPHNPTGYTPGGQEAEEITEAIKKCADKGSRILVILDDAYSGFVYEDALRESLFSRLAGLHENILAMKLDSISKEMYSWGLRVGFVTYGWKGANTEAYKEMEDKTAAAVRSTISNVSNISQSLVLRAISTADCEKQAREKYNILKERFAEVKKALADEKYKQYFSALPCNSGYFVSLKLRNTSAEKLRKKLLLNDTGVIATGGMIRVAFSCIEKNNIKAVFENIYNACSELDVNRQ